MAFFGLFKSKEEKAAEAEVRQSFDPIREQARQAAQRKAEEDKKAKIAEYEAQVFEKTQKEEYDKQMKNYQNIDLRTPKEKAKDLWNKFKEKGQQAGASLARNVGEGYGNVQKNLGGTGTQFQKDVGRTFKGAGEGFIKNIEKSPVVTTTAKEKKDNNKPVRDLGVQAFTRSITTPQAATEDINLQGPAQRPNVLNRGTKPLFTPRFGAGQMLGKRGQAQEPSRINFLLGKKDQPQQGQPDRVDRLRRFL
jgi:hypothetical protein